MFKQRECHKGDLISGTVTLSRTDRVRLKRNTSALILLFNTR